MREKTREIFENEIKNYTGNYLYSYLHGYLESYSRDKNTTKKEIFEIMEEYLNPIIEKQSIEYNNLIQSNKISENNQISRADSSDPVQEEKISTLEKEIVELKEELKKERINIEKADIRYLKMHEKLMKLENKHNTRGAGRKQKITEKEIVTIQILRAQGKTLQKIQAETGISYGNIQKYCKLITDKNKNGSVNPLPATDNKKRAGL